MRATFDAASLSPPSPPFDGSVVSIGVFDGVHLGHHEILRRNVETARELGAEPTVVTFRRHPKKVLLGRAPRTLTTLEHRIELFARQGIEHAVVLNFDEELRALSADEFADRYLQRGLASRHLVLGFDSKFGRDRGGTPESMAARGFAVTKVDKVVVAGRAVSSTAIREAVELGDLAGASAMLGRPVSVLGRVVRGDARGREIGFPTANLDLHHELHPPVGVYACRVALLEGEGAEPLPAVVNIGVRPTLEGALSEVPVVEVHIMDFEGDLYGERLEVRFVRRLREERRFAGLEALVAQIRADVEQARRILGAPGT